MTDERLADLLRTAISPMDAEASRDLWPAVADRLDERPRWSLVDLGLASAAALAVLSNPEWLWLLAYHL